MCEKRAEAFIDYRTVHKVLRRAAEGGFPYLKRRCLEFCLMHLREASWVLGGLKVESSRRGLTDADAASGIRIE